MYGKGLGKVHAGAVAILLVGFGKGLGKCSSKDLGRFWARVWVGFFDKGFDKGSVKDLGKGFRQGL